MKSILESLNNSLGKRMNESVKIIADLDDYTPWQGAVATWSTIIDADMKDAFEQYLEDAYPDGLTMTELNDMLWFDGEQVLEDLGIGEYPKDVDVTVVGIKYSPDVIDYSLSDDDLPTDMDLTVHIEHADDDVREIVLDALYDEIYVVDPGDIVDFEYRINEGCGSKSGKKDLKEESGEVSDEAYIVADMIMADHKPLRLFFLGCSGAWASGFTTGYAGVSELSGITGVDSEAAALIEQWQFGHS